MKILQLTAENIKRISVVRITPDGNLVQITGKNGQGKTSVLDSILWVLGGTAGVQEVPRRKGHAAGRIEVTLGDAAGTKLTVEKRFTEKHPRGVIDIRDPSGMKGGQTLLDGILETLAFDPLDFMRKPADQYTTLRKVVKLDVDVEALKRSRLTAFEKRTEVNRDLKRAVGAALAIVVPEDAPDAPPDSAPILARLAGVDHHNNAIRFQDGVRARTRQALADTRALIGNIEDEIEVLQKRLKQAHADRDAVQAEVAAFSDNPLAELQDASAIAAELTEAQRLIAMYEIKRRRKAADEQVAQLTAISETLTGHIDSIDQQKMKALAEAKMPIEGLAFGGDGVLFNGLPLEQASDAEQLMVSVSIAAALNPKLRVIRIRDGSLLDVDSLALLGKFAEERDYQVWIERVGAGETGIIIEDGHVKGQEELVAAFEKAEAGELADAATAKLAEDAKPSEGAEEGKLL